MSLTRSETVFLKYVPWICSILALFLSVIVQTWENYVLSLCCLLIAGHGLYLALHHAPRGALAASYLAVIGQFGLVFAIDRPLPSKVVASGPIVARVVDSDTLPSASTHLWLGILGFGVLPVAYGVCSQILTRRWWFAVGILLVLSPLLLTWLFVRDYYRFPLKVSMSSFLPIGLVGLIGPAIALGIQAVVALVSSIVIRFTMRGSRP